MDIPKEYKMKLSKLALIAGGVAMSSSLAFGWSISGTVKDAAKSTPLADVEISCFNYAGVSTKSDATGNFSIISETGSIGKVSNASMQATLRNNIFSLENANAHTLSIAVIDAMGKVTFQRSFYNIFGAVSIDLKKIANRSAKFIRVNADGNNSTYAMHGGFALLKEGEKMPVIFFAKAGYDNASYEMKSEVESNVAIAMYAAGTGPKSSSSAQIERPTSSAIVPVSSSEKVEVVVNCSGKEYKAGDHNMSVNVDGKNRTFIMHVPSTYTGDKAVPLVVDYHPIGGSGAGQMNDNGGTTYKKITDKEGVISLYPDGTTNHAGMMAGSPGWNVGPCCSDDDDIKFSREMIKAVEEKVCIDTKRVYATGFSMGGGMSNHAACNMADVYAAVAPAGMDLNSVNSASCKPARPISIIMFRGTNDFVCKYDGGDSGFGDGLNFLGAKKNFQFWAEKNGCTGSPSTNSNGCEEYSNCQDGVKVVLCTKQGGSHEQGDGSIGWPFLKSFTLP